MTKMSEKTNALSELDENMTDNEASRVDDMWELKAGNPKNTISHMLVALLDHDDNITPKQWQLIVKLAAGQIDPNTAEVLWWYRTTRCSPDGIWSDIKYFVHSPGSDELVPFKELPESSQRTIIERYDKMFFREL
jgi:hypothetical protein